MKHHTFCAAALAVALLSPAFHAQQKRPIDRADQLPVHSYAVTKAPSALLHDEAALMALAAAIRADLEADLAAYDIRDTSTLRSYYRALSTIAMLQHRPDDALEYENKARPLEEKPAARTLSGFTLRPLIAAEKAGATGAAQAFSAALAAELARLPYDSVQAELKTTRQRLGILSPTFLEGIVASEIDPAAKGGQLSKELALDLLNRSFALQRVLPYRDEIVRQLSALIDAHHVDKPDIWAARDVSLEGRVGLTPVVVAISDGGVDVALFRGRVWVNTKEIAGNGKDDDGNGYVDDVNGVAWTWDGELTTGDLRRLELSAADLARAKQNINGFMDVQAGLDSPQAQALRRLLAGMSKDEVKPFMESVQFYLEYAHGTHVAGIATRGNPAARVLNARFEAPYQMVPPPPTTAWAAGFARSLERTVAYYRKAGVKVVNMSWGMSSAMLENALELNGVGATQRERHQLAMQYFDTVKNAFQAAIAAAPEILFVSAAGNSDESNQFNEFIPASYDLPNTMTVGAVDQAGDEAAFTSFGKVDLYANGYAVESVLPGGEKHRWSGTSMAAPQVVNLAAKLLAAYPRLSVAEVKKLIVDGADAKDVTGRRTIHLLNEARSFELARGAQR
jgi:subtilisin family serine protease